MEYKKIDNHYIVRIDKDEEAVSKIKELCSKENIKCGYISAIGAAKKVEIGLFNTNTKEYKTNVKEGMFEITSLIGNISLMDNNVYTHLHINFSDEATNVYGGHLVSVIVSATMEAIITVIDGEVTRAFNEEIGLNLLNIE